MKWRKWPEEKPSEDGRYLIITNASRYENMYFWHYQAVGIGGGEVDHVWDDSEGKRQVPLYWVSNSELHNGIP